MEQTQLDTVGLLSDFNTKLRDMEEKQRLLKDRVLLIGENLVESRQENQKDITRLKIDTDEIKKEILKIKEVLQRIMEDLDLKARQSEVDSLKRQAKMFQPLEFARIQDVKDMLNKTK